MKETAEYLRSKKNASIISAFYFSKQTFVSKQELLEKGFDFSEWFTTSNLQHYFNNEEFDFEYKNFKCGGFYIKTRDKNLENPEKKERLFFEIIMLDFPQVEYYYKEGISFLRNRKYYEGTMIAHLSDRDMYDFELAQTYKKKLERLYLGKNLHLLQLKQTVKFMENTKKVFEDLIARIESDNTHDEDWV